MNYEIAKEKAIKYIGISKKTEFEVYSKLKKIGCDDETAQKVICYIKELGYINDYDYVDAYIRQCMRLFNYSIYEIKNKLLQKGINKYIIEEKLEILYNNGYEGKVLEKLNLGKLKDYDELKKKQYLYRRGFKINLD